MPNFEWFFSKLSWNLKSWTSSPLIRGTPPIFCQHSSFFPRLPVWGRTSWHLLSYARESFWIVSTIPCHHFDTDPTFFAYHRSKLQAHFLFLFRFLKWFHFIPLQFLPLYPLASLDPKPPRNASTIHCPFLLPNFSVRNSIGCSF